MGNESVPVKKFFDIKWFQHLWCLESFKIYFSKSIKIAINSLNSSGSIFYYLVQLVCIYYIDYLVTSSSTTTTAAVSKQSLSKKVEASTSVAMSNIPSPPKGLFSSSKLASGAECLEHCCTSTEVFSSLFKSIEISKVLLSVLPCWAVFVLQLLIPHFVALLLNVVTATFVIFIDHCLIFFSFCSINRFF